MHCRNDPSPPPATIETATELGNAGYAHEDGRGKEDAVPDTFTGDGHISWGAMLVAGGRNLIIENHRKYGLISARAKYPRDG